MKNFLMVVALAYGGYFAYQKFNSPHSAYLDRGGEPYIAVYGRDTCGYTSALRKYLDNAGVTYEYYSVDDRESADQLHAQMEDAGISTRHYNLPVVDVSGDISVRPNPQDVASGYQSAPH